MKFHGHARISRSNFEASGVCDLCAGRWTKSDLRFQYEWRGAALVSTGFLRCPHCIDEPSTRNKTFIIPPDQTPVRDPRPRPLAAYETDFLTDENGNPLVDDLGTVLLTR